ncbi:MAG: response regulator [Rhodothermales bacterium]
MPIRTLKRVVLIDDSAADLFLNRLVLEELSWIEHIDAYTYADEALAALTAPDAPDVDLILLDVNMPRMNGFEFAEAYEAAVPPDAAPVILMLSTSTHPEDIHRAKQLDCIRDYLTKPLATEHIHAILHEHFSTGEAS